MAAPADMASSDRVDHIHVDPASQPDSACMLDVLPPDSIVRILKLLSQSPESIVAFSLTCGQAHQLCFDETMWKSLCSELTASLPQAYRSVDWEPAAWHAESYQELYMCLLHPYRPLLQQRVWWSAKMLAGQLLVVDAQPPLLVGRSVSYTSLQAGPVSHAVFMVRMPRTPLYALMAYMTPLNNPAEQPPPQGKAQVLCCCCQPTRILADSQHELFHGARSGQHDSLCRATYMAAAHLTLPTTGRGSEAQAAAEPAAAAGAVCSSTPSTGHPTAALSLSCSGSCGNLYAEQLARMRFSNNQNFTPQGTTAPAAQPVSSPSPAAAADAPPAPTAAAAAAAPAGPDASIGGGHNGNAAANNQGSSSSSSRLPLPDVTEPESFPVWDLRYHALEEDIPKMWRSTADYRIFDLPTWLQPAGQAAASVVDGAGASGIAGQAAASAVGGAGVGETAVACSSSRGSSRNNSDSSRPWSFTPAEDAAGCSSSSSRGNSSRGNSSASRAWPLTPAASAAAVGLTGLWRGSYGSHGVELVSLQLLHAPPGYQLQQQYGPADGPPLGFGELPRNVLLQNLLQLPPPVIHSTLCENLGLSVDQADGAAQQAAAAAAAAIDVNQAEGAAQQVALPAAGNTTFLATSVVVDGVDNAQQQQQQQQEEKWGVSALHPPQQLLLVATKVTGDRNVPAGQVTFAVDLGSRSTAGAGQLLQLPPGTHSDVRVMAAGTQPLVIKERFSGLAQIAEVYFQNPRVLPVELLVFESSDCLGLLWKSPMDSFSLFSRVSGLL